MGEIQKTKQNLSFFSSPIIYQKPAGFQWIHYIPPPYKKCPFKKISCCPNILLLLFVFSLRPTSLFGFSLRSTSQFGFFTSPHFSVWIFHFAPLFFLDFHFAPLLCLDFSLRPTSLFGFFTSPHFSVWIFTWPTKIQMKK